MPYLPEKKLIKRKENNITPAKTNVPISQTSSKWMSKTNNSNLSNEKQRT